MGIPIQGDFDLAAAKPIDSRFTWTGTAANLNQIAFNGANRYPGLVTYVTGDQNLYLFQGGTNWEKIVTTNVDSVININSNFTFSSNHNGQVLYINSANNITGTLPSLGSTMNSFPSGYNVSVVQLGNGSIVFMGGGAGASQTFFRNRINLDRTAGRYAVASILRLNEAEFLLFGDLV